MEKTTNALLSALILSGSGCVARRDKVCYLRAGAAFLPSRCDRPGTGQQAAPLPCLLSARCLLVASADLFGSYCHCFVFFLALVDTENLPEAWKTGQSHGETVPIQPSSRTEKLNLSSPSSCSSAFVFRFRNPASELR